MGESSDVALSEKKLKRTVKTQCQVEGLEKFYDEHKYPTETMKSELAKSLGLTEKQISGWFCHRRLKDKRLLNGDVYANGRQDRSSGVVQDRGSGLRQGSCGSNKQGDYRNSDPREVESRRFTGQDISAADLTYELGSHYTGNFSDMDDTSSGTSSPLRDRSFPLHEDPSDMATSRHLTKSGNTMLVGGMGVKPRSGPSGYLKVKGQVENAAVSAVKRQLGRHYQEDGPSLGIEFDSIPPGAFESSTRDPVNEPSYVCERSLPRSSDISTIHKLRNNDERYEGYYSKMSSYKSDFDGIRFKMMHGSDRNKNYSHHNQFKQKSLSNHSNSFAGRNSSMEMNEDSTGEMSVYDSRGNYDTRAKHVGEGRMDYVSIHYVHLYGQKEPLLHNYDDVSLNDAQRERFESKPSKAMLNHGDSHDLDDIAPSRRMSKEDKSYGERRATNEHYDPIRVKDHPTNEIRLAKRARDEYPKQQFMEKASIEEMSSHTDHIRRLPTEIPSSFSEDETSSSTD